MSDAPIYSQTAAELGPVTTTNSAIAQPEPQAAPPPPTPTPTTPAEPEAITPEPAPAEQASPTLAVGGTFTPDNTDAVALGDNGPERLTQPAPAEPPTHGQATGHYDYDTGAFTIE